MIGRKSLREIREVLAEAAAADPTLFHDEGNKAIKAIREFIDGVKTASAAKSRPTTGKHKKKAVTKRK